MDDTNSAAAAATLPAVPADERDLALRLRWIEALILTAITAWC
jgi:hypothetical protein